MAAWRERPADVRPMLASLSEPPVAQRGLLYEPKYDGIRALVDLRPAAKKGAEPELAVYSRNGHDKRRQFPEIAAALLALAKDLPGPVLLDGEIVAIDGDGRPMGFQQIQGRIHLSGESDIERGASGQPTALILFDLLRDGDEDLRGEPLAARRLRLQARVRPRGKLRDRIRLSELVPDDGRAMLQRARNEGWEGLIVKDGESKYASGRRSPAWRKLKLQAQQEFVIGGWTEPRLTRTHFGALLVGYHDAAGALRWAGSVGTGFDQKELERLSNLFATRARTSSPFADAVKVPETPHWLRPDLVAEVRFTEWTADGLLRHPVYLGTRDDKRAADVVREMKSAGPSRQGRPDAVPPVLPARGIRGPRRPSKTTAKAALARTRDHAARTGGPGRMDTAGLAALSARLEELEAARKDADVALPNGDTLRVTNLHKIFWPDLKITKGELLRYYVAAAPYILPVVDDRPLVMKRFPNGVDKHAFYQQRHPEATPPGVRREVLPDDVDPIDEEGPRDRLIGGSLTTLLYMTQLAAISQDPWFSRVADPMHQDYAAIDLDPDEAAGLDRVLDVARYVKEQLDRFDIPAVPKTSGSRGLHIYVPLAPGTTYETGQLLCQMIATIVATAHPKIATIERMVRRRPRGTVSIDYLQNILGKTLATAYSARASAYAGVSTPLTWDEVARGVNPRDFTIRTAPARFREVGDLWAALRTKKPVDLPKLLRKAGLEPA